ASPAARIGVGLIWRKKATRGNPSSQLKPCAARDTHKCFLTPRFHAGPGRGDWRYDTRPGAADDDGQISRTRVRHASASAPLRSAPLRSAPLRPAPRRLRYTAFVRVEHSDLFESRRTGPNETDTPMTAPSKGLPTHIRGKLRAIASVL